MGMPRAGIRSVVNHDVVIRNNNADQNSTWGIFSGFSDDLLIEGNVASPRKRSMASTFPTAVIGR